MPAPKSRLRPLPDDIAALLSTHHGVVTVERARNAGILDARLRYWCSKGLLTRVGHGTYVATAQLRQADSWHSVALRGEGFVRSLHPAAFLVGSAAAAIHGLRTVGRAARLPEVVAPPYTGLAGRSTSNGTIRRARLPVDHMRSVRGGTQVMSPAWIAVDLARRLPIAPALIMLDGVARDHQTEAAKDEPRERGLTGTDLADAANTIHGWSGSRRATRLVTLADPGAERAIESAGRAAFLTADLPESVSNAWLPLPNGRWRRVDHLWPWHGVVGEGDGALKYDELDRPSLVIADEKEREWELRELGLVVGRYTWEHAEHHPATMGQRFGKILDDNPPKNRPMTYWIGRSADDRVEATPGDWPAPEPRRSLLPAGGLW